MTTDAYLYNYHDVIFTQIATLQMQYNETESHIRKAEDILKIILSKLKDDLYGEISVNPLMETLDVDVWDTNLIDVLKKECTGYIEDENEPHPFYFHLKGIEIRIVLREENRYCMSASYKYKTNRIL